MATATEARPKTVNDPEFLDWKPPYKVSAGDWVEWMRSPGQKDTKIALVTSVNGKYINCVIHGIGEVRHTVSHESDPVLKAFPARVGDHGCWRESLSVKQDVEFRSEIKSSLKELKRDIASLLNEIDKLKRTKQNVRSS